MTAIEEWRSAADDPPPEGVVVQVMNNDGALLKRQGRLWFFGTDCPGSPGRKIGPDPGLDRGHSCRQDRVALGYPGFSGNTGFVNDWRKSWAVEQNPDPSGLHWNRRSGSRGLTGRGCLDTDVWASMPRTNPIT